MDKSITYDYTYTYGISQKRVGYIEISSEEIIDFRNNNELIELLKQYKKVIYNCHCPLEWLPDEVMRIEVRETYDIDKIDGEVCIFGEECNYLGDIELLEQIKKYKKLLSFKPLSVIWWFLQNHLISIGINLFSERPK